MNHSNNNITNWKVLQLSYFLFLIPYFLFTTYCKNHQHNDKKIFHYNEQSGIASLDPAFAKNLAICWPVHQLYNTLLEIDEHLELQPSFAKSWEISENNLTLTFHLRTDVYFHDDACFANGKGRSVNANDVTYSFNRIIDKAVASPGAWIFNNRIDTLNPFIALNDS